MCYLSVALHQTLCIYARSLSITLYHSHSLAPSLIPEHMHRRCVCECTTRHWRRLVASCRSFHFHSGNTLTILSVIDYHTQTQIAKPERQRVREKKMNKHVYIRTLMDAHFGCMALVCAARTYEYGNKRKTGTQNNYANFFFIFFFYFIVGFCIFISECMQCNIHYHRFRRSIMIFDCL